MKWRGGTSLRRIERSELLDAPGLVIDDLAGNLRDLRLLNRWFGGTGFALQQVRPFLTGGSMSVLDVATGTADIPLAVQSWGRRSGVSIRATGVDSSVEVLAAAEALLPDATVSLRQADARELPFEDGSFDLVLCNLALHHFAPREAHRVLSEMWRVSRVAAIVTDLTRSRAGYLATWLVTRTLARNRLTRHDGPLSVRRAYDSAELLALAGGAGWQNVIHHRHPLFRQAVVGTKVAINV